MKRPEKLCDSLWYKLDDTFKTPKTIVCVIFRTPLVMANARNRCLSILFTLYAKDVLDEKFYDATLAGFSYTISVTINGIKLSVAGYSDKMALFLQKFINQLASLDVDEKRFDVVKAEHRRELENYKFSSPYSQASYRCVAMICEKFWSVEDQLTAIDSIEAQDAQATFGQYLKQSNPEILVHGNQSDADTLKLRSIIVDTIMPRPPDASLLGPVRTVKIPKGCSIYAPPPIPNNNNAIDVYLQVNSMDRRDHVLTLLFVQIFNESFFTILRTKEQLGYLVRHTVSYMQGVPGLKFSIQSERTPIHLDDRIETFIEEHAKSFLNGSMTLEDFERHKQALITELLKKNRKIAEEASVYWGEIETQLCDFERAKLNAELLRQDISPLDMQLFASRFIWRDASERRKLAVHIWSDAAFKEDPSPTKYGGRHVIRDRVSFLNSCELYPGLPPRN